jgi:septal ring factor EnvC (AmiA/AmiB activator)
LFNATKGAVDWSPNTMYFFASNYVDGIAKALTGTVNLGLTVTGQKDFDLKNDTLFLSSFVGTKSNVDAREFSKVENQIKQTEKRINALKDKPDLLESYLEEHAEDYYLVQYYNQQVNGTLRQLRTNANQIRANREISIGERKEKLEEIVKMQNLVKRQLLNNFESISGIKP